MHTGPTTRTESGRRPSRCRRAGVRPWAALLLASVLPLAAAAPALSAPAEARTARAVRALPPAQRLAPDVIALMQRLRIPGAIVSVDSPETGDWTAALGTRDLATGAPMTLGDHMRIGSITKTFTATLILQLVQDGRLTLADKVAKYIPGVPNGRKITIRQLLQMTSGLYNYSEDVGFNERLDRDPEGAWTPQQLLDIAFSHPVDFQPGDGFHYSNTNYVLLGLIAEQLTHQPIAQLFQHRIFDRVGMHETTFNNDTVIPYPHAQGYQFIGNVAALTAPVLTGKAAAWADWSAGNPDDVTHANASWTWAAGGAESTLDDLRRWAPVLATGTPLLSPEIQRERLTFVSPSGKPGEPTYGLGIGDFGGFLGHTGMIPGYNSFVGYDPARCATIVVLVNLNQSPDGEAPAAQLTKLIIADLFH
jgi:D-alanyl-D-alanine carboxypeptidase